MQRRLLLQQHFCDNSKIIIWVAEESNSCRDYFVLSALETILLTAVESPKTQNLKNHPRALDIRFCTAWPLKKYLQFSKVHVVCFFKNPLFWWSFCKTLMAWRIWVPFQHLLSRVFSQHVKRFWYLVSKLHQNVNFGWKSFPIIQTFKWAKY